MSLVSCPRSPVITLCSEVACNTSQHGPDNSSSEKSSVVATASLREGPMPKVQEGPLRESRSRFG